MARTQISHHRIVDHLRARINGGTLRKGDRLPSFEQLHRQFGVAPKTISKAFNVLEQDGLVDRRERSGVFVARTMLRRVVPRIACSGVVVQGLNTDYWNRLVAGLQTAAHRCGAEISFVPDPGNCIWEDYNGLLAFGGEGLSLLRKRPFAFPAVALGHLVPTTAVRSVAFDEYTAGYLATKHLIDLGHSRIAILQWSETPVGGFRIAGYYAAMGLLTDKLRQRLIDYRATFSGVAPGFERSLVRSMGFPLEVVESIPAQNMEQWFIDGFAELDCTAIVAPNDEHAAAIMRVLANHGYRVPEDISVVGFDNERDSAHGHTPLTSVGADTFDLAACAVKKLLDMIDGIDDGLDVVLPVDIHVRESTAPPSR